MVGVLRMVWRSGRCCLEWYPEFQVTVYGGHGGMHGEEVGGRATSKLPLACTTPIP